MKLHRAWYVGLIPLLPSMASADLPLSNAELGQMEGILSFCSKVNPELTKVNQQRLALLIGKASAQELADARSSEEYKAAYASAVSESDRKAPAKACNGEGR